MDSSPATGGLSYKVAGMMQALTGAIKDQLAPVVTPFWGGSVVLISMAMVVRKTVEVSRE